MAAVKDVLINFFINSASANSALDKLNQNFSRTMGGIRNTVLGVIGARGLLGMYNSMQRIAQVSERFSLPIENVSRFANTFAAVGGDVDDAANAIERLQQMARDLRFNSSGPLRELSAVIGTNLYNKDYMGIIQALRQQFSNLNQDAQVKVLDMLGMDNIAMQRLLKMTDEEFADANKRGEQFGVMTQENYDNFRKMQSTVAELKQTLLMASVPIMEGLKPILDVLADIAHWFNGLPDSMKKFIAGAVVLLPIVKKLLGLFIGKNGLLTMLKGGGTGGVGLRTLGWIGLLVAMTPGLINLADSMWDVAKGSKDMETALAELTSRDDIVGFLGRIGAWIGKGLFNFKDWVGAQDARINSFFGAADSRDATYLRTYLDRHRENMDPETIAKYEDAISKLESSLAERSADARLRYIQDVASNYATPIIQSPQSAGAWGGMSRVSTTDSHNQTTVDNGTTTINIYGVNGADDLISRLRSIPNNNISPILGYK